MYLFKTLQTLKIDLRQLKTKAYIKQGFLKYQGGQEFIKTLKKCNLCFSPLKIFKCL